jgi:hypothetical protein
MVEVACPTETCTATAEGRTLVPGAARTFELTPVSARIDMGHREKMKLRLSGRVWRTALRALNARKRVRVRVRLTARDTAGNVAATQRGINLKR